MVLTVIASMEQELAGLRRQLRLGWRPGGAGSLPDQKENLSLDLQVIGMGKQASVQLRSMLEKSNGLSGRGPQQTCGLLLLGLAGAVVSGLETGDLVLSSRYYRPYFDDNASLDPLENEPRSSNAENQVRPTPFDKRVPSKDFLAPAPELWQLALSAVRNMENRAVFADSLTLCDLVTAPSAKQAVARRYPVSIVNMEDYWVASVAQDAGVPFFSARAILDPAHQALPGYLPGMAGSRSKTLLRLVVTPWRIPTLVGLARQAEIAQRALTSFAMNFLTQVFTTAPAHGSLPNSSWSILV